MQKLGAVEAFVKAAETRNFAEAGRQLGISLSTVGKAISRLEERLGVRLFHRSTRSATLTPEGQLYLVRCLRVLEEIDAAEAELSVGATPKGNLRVSVPLVGTFLAPVLADFIACHPAIHLELDFNDRITDVIEEGFDVVLRTGESVDSRLMSRVLGHYSPVIVGTPRYFERAGIPLEPEDLHHHGCLLHRFPSTGRIDRWALASNGASIDVPLPAVATMSAVEPLIQMAEAHAGIAYVPDFLVRQRLEDGTLVEVLETHVHDRKVFRALWPSGKHPSAKIRVFTEFLGARLFGGE